MNNPSCHLSLKWSRCVRIALVLVITCTGLPAAPYFGEEAFTYQQPDDEAFEIRLFGDEFFAYQETVDGYLVIHDPNNGFFCYANVTPDGSDIVSTGVRVGHPKPAGLKPKQRLGKGKAMVKSLNNRNLLGVDDKGRRNPGKKLKVGKNEEILNMASDEPVIQFAPGDGTTTESDSPIVQPAPPAGPTLNKRVGLVLLASFPDRPGDITKTVADIDNYCNAETYTADGNSTSVYGYFKLQSNGKLIYKNTVTAWFTAANPRSYYTDKNITYSLRAKELIREGLAALKAQGFDFTQCDANNDGKIDGVNCFYAGAAVNGWGNGLWPHKSNAIWNDFAGTGITDTSFDYQITDMPSSLALATFCHENGHMLCDFPDLYSYDGNASRLGDYSLMAAGGSIGRPRNVDPYLKIHAGWADVVDLTSSSQQRCAVQIDRNFFYRYKNPAKPEEYLLFEARGAYGYEGSSGGVSAINPGSGLVAYHALDTGSNGNSTIFTNDAVTNYTTPYELMLVEASPTPAANPWYDAPTPDPNDAFSASGVSSISDSTYPELKFWASNGRTVTSGANINTISAPGATITFTVGSPPLPATPATAITANLIEQDTDFGDTAASQSFAVFNGAGGTLSYTISDDATWLSCSPANGTATTEADVITVSYTTAALAVGTHTGTITVNGGSAGVKTITVTLTVNPRPTIATSPASISLAGVAGASLLQTTFHISNTGGGTVGYALSNTQPWLSLDRTSGTVATERDLITVTLDAKLLAAGVHNDTITITSAEATNPSVTIPVTFTITGANMIVASPNGAEKWIRGSSRTIAWSSGIGGNVKIELLKNGVLYTVISSSTPNDGSFSWSVPTGQLLGANYRIRISSVATPAVTDQSNADFSIVLPPIYAANMDTNPGWTMQGAWAWGTPAGAGGDPNSGCTGSNVIGFNLAGTYANSLPETHVTTQAIDCSNRSNVKLSFYRWLGIEAGNFDKAYVRVSNDGVNWTNVFVHNSSSYPTRQDTAWGLETYNISSIADGRPAVYVRWTMGTTDGSLAYSGWNIDDVVIDGDSAVGATGIVRTESGGSTAVAESGATDNYSLALSSVPTANVTIAIIPDSQVTVSSSSLTFTTSNWSTPQTITVTAVNDSVNEFTHIGEINHSATSTDPNYNAIPIDGFPVQITDNDNTAPVVDPGPNQTVNLVGVVWSPADLNPIAWYDASDETTITQSGGLVSQWNSMVGTSHMVQATGTQQPGTGTTQINGLNTIAFDGTDDALKTTTNPFGASISNALFMAVTNIGTTSSSTMFSLSGFGSGSNRWQSHAPWGDNTLYFDCGDSSGNTRVSVATGWSANQNLLLGFYGSTTDSVQQVWADGTNIASDISGHTIAVSSGIALGHDGTSLYDNCRMGEVVIVNGTVSTLNRQKLEGHLAHKWGLQGNLPAGHPYKTQSPTNASVVVNLNGTASDANGDPITTTWSVVNGPGTVVFGDANAIDTTATFTKQGVYTLRLSASDSGATTSGDVVITVNLPLSTYTLTYAGNNNTGGTAPLDSNSPYTQGTTVTVLGNSGTLIRAGHNFNNWNTAANGSGTAYAPGNTFTISANTTLYAQWTPLTYAVTFDKQTGTGGSTGVTATFGSAMPTATAPTRAGFNFGGYYTEVSGGGTQYYSAAMASTRNWDLPANTTLYAYWTPMPYTVTFDKQGGTGGSDSVSATNGAAMPTATAPTRDGYIFGGYYAQVSGGGTQYYSATMASMTNWDLAANATLYARWTTGTDGLWIQTAAGPFDWGTSLNWNGGTIANGAAKTASFTPNIAATQVVNLESPRTIGNITFTDSTTSSHNLTISGTNILTLAQNSSTPAVNVTQLGRTLTISSQISGVNGLKKEGAGQLTLSGTNSFSGGITLNAGTLATGTDANFGNSANRMTVTGNATWHAGSSVTSYSRSFTVNNGVTLTLASGNSSKTITGALVGSGAIVNSATTTFEFSNTGNTFTGTVNNGYETKFTSLGDSANPINLVGSNSNFTWQGSAKTFALRPFTLNAAGTGKINNNGSNALTIQQDLAFSGSAGARILALQGNNTGANTFSGNIGNYGSSEVSLTKAGSCTWVLSGVNSYTGATTVSVGKLFINGDQSLATGDVSVAASATLGGTGSVGGNINIAASGKLEFDLSSSIPSYNKLDLAAGKTLTFTAASTLTITSAGNAQTGSYTLLTAPGGIIGVAPATLNLPSGWAATASIVGNDLVLNITSLGPNTVDHFAISTIASPQTVGTPITGITLTAQNSGNQTATSFTGTVTFGGTAGITGTSANFVNGVLSGISFTPTVTGGSRSFTVNDGSGHTGTAYFTVQTRYASWSATGFTYAFYDTDSASNPDGDSLTNLQEFAFGTDPTLPVQQSLDFEMDGDVTTPGLPVILNFSATSTPDYRAVFARRKDYQTAGLVYAVEFTADLELWTISATTPIRLTHANSAGDMDAVSVPFPTTVPLIAGGNAAPKFFRVSVQ